MSKLKMPAKYQHLDSAIILSMPIKLLKFKEGILETLLFANLEEFLKHHNSEEFIGPFADRLGEKECLRFETKEAARYLSN
jgi:hypothetical protein